MKSELLQSIAEFSLVNREGGVILSVLNLRKCLQWGKYLYFVQ